MSLAGFENPRVSIDYAQKSSSRTVLGSCCCADDNIYVLIFHLLSGCRLASDWKASLWVGWILSTFLHDNNIPTLISKQWQPRKNITFKHEWLVTKETFTMLSPCLVANFWSIMINCICLLPKLNYDETVCLCLNFRSTSASPWVVMLLGFVHKWTPPLSP